MEPTYPFTIHAQPIVEIATRRVWYHELFAEYRGIKGEAWSGQDGAVLRWCAETTLRRGLGHAVGVNVPVEILDDVVDTSVEIANRGHAVHVEILETGEIGDAVLAAVRAMQRGGVHVLLDDVGSGDRDVADVHRHRWDGVKVDGAIVQRAFDGDADAARVLRSVASAHRRVVVEHVESAVAVSVMQRFGVRYAQGHATGRPAIQGVCREIGAPQTLRLPDLPRRR